MDLKLPDLTRNFTTQKPGLKTAKWLYSQIKFPSLLQFAIAGRMIQMMSISSTVKDYLLHLSGQTTGLRKLKG